MNALQQAMTVLIELVALLFIGAMVFDFGTGLVELWFQCTNPLSKAPSKELETLCSQALGVRSLLLSGVVAESLPDSLQPIAGIDLNVVAAHLSAVRLSGQICDLSKSINC